MTIVQQFMKNFFANFFVLRYVFGGTFSLWCSE